MSDTKTCANPSCSKAFTRRLSTRESKPAFAARKHCCFGCATATSKGRQRVLPRKTAQLVEVVREPGQPWRPAGWTREPNVYGTLGQGC